ncbi:MAG: Tfp pilus assembly protein FimT/FimU [bacterium]
MNRLVTEPADIGGTSSRAFTLIELLVVVALLGIAGAMVIPAMGSVGALRVQAAVRTVVSDLTFAQSDAIAFQERRAVLFDVPGQNYRLVSVVNGNIDPDAGTLFSPDGPGGRYIVSLRDPRYGNAILASANFNNQTRIIYDDLGTPVAAPGSDQPGTGGVIRIDGSGQSFDVIVEPFTGRVNVRRVERSPVTVVPLPDPEPIPGGETTEPLPGGGS